MQHINTIWITGMVEVINMLNHAGAILWVTHGVVGAQEAQRLTTSMHRSSTDAAHARTTGLAMGKTHVVPLLLSPTMRIAQAAPFGSAGTVRNV